MVIIEHDMRFLFRLADRISVIHWGQVIARGTPARAARQPVGAALRARSALEHVMLELRDVDTYYGETQVLFGVSLGVAAGEVVALLGPNGAGKTTTLRSILGLTPRAARQRALRRPRRHALADASHRPRAASAGCPTTGASFRR